MPRASDDDILKEDSLRLLVVDDTPFNIIVFEVFF